MFKNKALIQDINDCSVPKGKVAYWWLGQHGFVYKIGKSILYLDAYLTPNPKRLIAPLLSADEVTHVDLVIGSHDHSDHIDKPSWPLIAKASPQAKFLIPTFCLAKIEKDTGISKNRILTLNASESFEYQGIKITAIASAHEFLSRDEKTGNYPYLGFVIEGNGICFYHSGDTCIYEGLQTTLSAWKLDAVFLPINGRSAEKLKNSIIGNMTYQEAVDLSGNLKPGLTVPTHFDMFEKNTENPQLFLDYLKMKFPLVNGRVPEYGLKNFIG